MALAGIELRYIVNHLSEMIADETYYVNNVYGITRDSLLFKLHHATKEDMFLMVSTYGIWLTTTKMSQIEENRMQRRLRSTLLRLKLSGIRQEGAERIAYITFEGFGSEFTLVVELFGDGNVILCSTQEMKILALMRSVRVRHRTLGVGSTYAPPPAPSNNTIDVLDLARQNFDAIRNAQMAPARWIGRTLGLPRKYAEGIITMARIPRGVTGEQLDTVQADAICDAAKRLVYDVVSGSHTPVVIRGETAEALPVDMRYDDDNNDDSHNDTGGQKDAGDGHEKLHVERVTSFMEGLDSVFTESLLARAKDARVSGSAGKIRDLQTMVAEQKKAIELVKKRSESVTAVARALVNLASQQGVLSISDDRVAAVLGQCGSGGLVKERGSHVLLLPDGGKKMPMPDMSASLQSVASMLYDEAKHQARAAPTIQKAMDDAQRRLDKLLGTAESERVLAGEEAGTAIRKKSWFERYRWFYTSGGLLAIGGRDAASNSAVIRKQMGKDDRIFHAEVHGSPFFILKHDGNSAEQPSDVSMNEVAHATVCFSRAWREGMHGMSAFWVEPDQVKRSAPTGQFMPKGSFTISGRRNFVRAQALRLAVAIIQHNGAYVAVCGPPEPIMAKSVLYAIIEPHGMDLADVAKRVRSEFMRIDANITQSIPLDDLVRVLPSGRSQVRKVDRGPLFDAQQDATHSA